MSILQKIKNYFVKPSDVNHFLRYGNRPMYPTFSKEQMTDQDIYTGYVYSAIRTRANTLASYALENIKTDREGVTHPYLDIISKSPQYTDYQFWHDISTYIDLKGVFYLFVLRNLSGERLTTPTRFDLLNPYHITRVIDSRTGDIIGYTENRYGMMRDIPPYMIIEIKNINPFNHNENYSLVNALTQGQFTLRSANNYTATAINNNINAPGIISTDKVIHDRQEFMDFVERVKSHTKGEPLFGNGIGSVTYQSMTDNLKDKALSEIVAISKEQIMAVAGVSKTILGIEESGTTRDTSRVQKELFIENQIIPQIKLIINALNQDYRNNYSRLYNSRPVNIICNNPYSNNHEKEIQEIEIKTKKYELIDRMLQKYDISDIYKYIENDELLPETKKENTKIKKEEKQEKKVLNKINTSSLIDSQQKSLKNEIVGITKIMLSNAIKRIEAKKVKNDIAEVEIKESDIATVQEEEEYKLQLEQILLGFYFSLSALLGDRFMSDRIAETGGQGTYTTTKRHNDRMKNLSNKVAISHIETVRTSLYEKARELAKSGAGIDEITRKLRLHYEDQITKVDALRIARTETNRIFTALQYEADNQFLDQNKLMGRAYKKWVTRSSNPCPVCLKLSQEPPIPYNQNFRDFGATETINDKTYNFNFTSLEYGNAHPNCSCTYELIIEPKEQKNKVEKKTNELEKLLLEML